MSVRTSCEGEFLCIGDRMQWRAVVRDSEALTARLNRPGMDGIPSLLERYLAAAIKGDTALRVIAASSIRFT